MTDISDIWDNVEADVQPVSEDATGKRPVIVYGYDVDDNEVEGIMWVDDDARQ